MRLIDADDLLKQYDKEHEGPPGRARELIENAPTVGKYGEWKIISKHKISSVLIRCNVCNLSFCVFDDELNKFKYCPNCAMPMRCEYEKKER